MDAVIFAGGVLTTIVLWYDVDQFALLVPYLLGHFFLFCNTFRVGGGAIPDLGRDLSLQCLLLASNSKSLGSSRPSGRDYAHADRSVPSR